MKTSLLTLISVFIISNTLYSQCDFYEDYSTNLGWTQVGTDVEIVGGKLEYINGAPDGYSGGTAVGEQKRVYKSLGTTLNSNDTWIAEFEFKPTSVASHLGQPWTGHALLAITAGTQNPHKDCPDLPCTGFPSGTQDGVIVNYATNNPPDGNIPFWINAYDNSTGYSSGGMMYANTLNTTYYLRMERTSSTNIMLSVFSDPARTVHITNSPENLTIPSTVTGLNTVQHGNTVQGDYRRELTGSIDNLCINFNHITGIFNSKLNAEKLNLYPNPNSGQFVIDIENIKDNALIEIVDLMGAKIYSKNITSDKIAIDISNKPKGIYLVKIINEESTITQKFIKTE